VANFTSNEVSAYSIASNGTLTPLPDSPFPAGVRPVSVAITRCTKPPTITDASVNPAVLWPPNHKMVDVTVNYDVTAGCGTTTTMHERNSRHRRMVSVRKKPLTLERSGAEWPVYAI